VTRTVELIGGSMDGQKVFVHNGMTAYQVIRREKGNVPRLQRAVLIETYAEREGGKFLHIMTERGLE